MFILQSSQPSYSGNAFASSSCQTEFNGEIEEVHIKCSLGGLSSSKGGLRRNSSNLSQLSSQDLCAADATQVEFDISSLVAEPFYVSIQTPTGETGVLHFNQYGTAQEFKPMRSGCGHGLWTIRVCQMKNGSEICLAKDSIQLDGVGTLFFAVGEDFVPRLSGQEFLYMSGLCAKHRH